jgi:hypothetical protein
VAGRFREPGHLPHLREGGEPEPPEGLPRQRRGTTPQMHGRYPDYDVLAHAEHWDETTRSLVLDRVDNVPPIRFFTDDEAGTLALFCDTVLAQDADPRVPVLAMVDAKLFEGRLDGFRFADMPDDRETWRRVARGLDEAAGGSFAGLDDAGRREVVGRFAERKLTGGVWDEMPCATAWSVVMRAVLSAFYSHPWAWNEIGYGGPRYPRGYIRMHPGGHAPDEAVETFDIDPVRDVAERSELR